MSFDIDPSQNVNITFTQNTTSIEMMLTNNSGIMPSNIGFTIKAPDKVPNPETGEFE